MFKVSLLSNCVYFILDFNRGTGNQSCLSRDKMTSIFIWAPGFSKIISERFICIKALEGSSNFYHISKTYSMVIHEEAS